MGYIDAGHAYSKTRLGLNRSDDPSFTSRTPYSPYEMQFLEHFHIDFYNSYFIILFEKNFSANG